MGTSKSKEEIDRRDEAYNNRKCKDGIGDSAECIPMDCKKQGNNYYYTKENKCEPTRTEVPRWQSKMCKVVDGKDCNKYFQDVTTSRWAGNKPVKCITVKKNYPYDIENESLRGKEFVSCTDRNGGDCRTCDEYCQGNRQQPVCPSSHVLGASHHNTTAQGHRRRHQ